MGPILIRVALITLAERKILRLIGRRLGPNKVSFQGIIQPIADALKLRNKRSNLLTNFSMFIYYASTIVMLIISFGLWSCYYNFNSTLSWKNDILIVIIILGVAAIKSIIAGWRTYRKYSLIGRMRTVSQIISYESVLYLCFLILIWICKAFKTNEIFKQKLILIIFLIPLICYFWIPSVLAELRRTPYDFSEGERELVRGFNTEFGSKSFTLIFLREYRNMIFFITLTVIILIRQKFFFIFFTFVCTINFWVVWVRRTLPRIRFDKFIRKAWKFYIPFITIILALAISKV